MLEKPDIPDLAVISRLQEEYGLQVAALTFLPIGADTGTIVYRVLTQGGTTYFLKLRKGFTEIVVTVPLFLRSQGIQEIIIPFETKTKGYWADFGDYKMILYPFIEGKNSFDMGLSDQHKRRLGRTLKVPGGATGGVVGGTGDIPVVDYDQPARPIRLTKPVYPQEGFVKKIEGTVVVEILIDVTGRVSRARVVQSIPALDAAALACVRQWIFAPAMRHGRPVPTLASAPVHFKIY